MDNSTGEVVVKWRQDYSEGDQEQYKRLMEKDLGNNWQKTTKEMGAYH
jgi:hypothetical protein